MGDSVALYTTSDCKSSIETILESIRASDYIDEVNSGEGPREESGLYKLVQPVDAKVSSVEEAIKDLSERVSQEKDDSGRDKWNALCLIVADKQADGDRPVVHLISVGKNGPVKSKLKCAIKSVIEPACNLSIGNMGIEEFQNAAGDDGIFDTLA